MSYVALSLFWTVAGLAAGYWLGRAGRFDRHLEAVMVNPAPSPWWRRHLLGTRLFGALLVALSVLSVIVGATFIDRQAAIVECQHTYNRAFAAAIIERNEAAAREREGQRRLLDESFRPREQRDPAALVAAYQQYLALLAGADAQRNANPVPVLTC